MKSIATFIAQKRGILLALGIIFLALYTITPQINRLDDSIDALQRANLLWVIAGTLVFFLSTVSLGIQYLLLAFHPIKLYTTIRVQIAGLFVSKLLPGSLGTISLNYYFLYKNHHKGTEAGTVMAVNGITTNIAFNFLILFALFLSNDAVNAAVSDASIPFTSIIFVLSLLLLAISLIIKYTGLKHRIRRILIELKNNILSYKNRPMSLIWAIILNGFSTFCSVFALYASAHALGVNIGATQAFVAYVLMNVAVGALPTPGGIGAAEAGIYTALTVLGIDSVSALSVTVLFRFITYWLAMLVGYISFASLRKDVLSSFRIK